MQSTELANFSFSQAFITNVPSMSFHLHVPRLIDLGIPGHRRGGHHCCPKDTQEAWCRYRSE